jgi:hypothetical protein
MACPPGKVLNPHTLRCISSRGRIAKDLVKAGNIDAGELRYVVGAAPARRRTMKVPRLGSVAAAEYGYIPGSRPTLIQLPRQAAPAPAPAPCPPGYEQNPTTGRCIRVGGRTYKRVYQVAAPILQRPTPPPPPAPLGIRPVQPVQQKRTLSEVPEGNAVPAPLADRRTVLTWAGENCRNAVDPITNMPLLSAPADSLQELLRLHDGTCTFATPLNKLVTAEHKAGRSVPIPGSIDRTPMTLEDFAALRSAMRRKNPDYKLPARRHAPPPPEWKLYVASDSRSGPDYATVGFVDTTKGRRTAYGVEYPADAFRVNMGFLPAYSPKGAFCSVQTVVDILQRLAAANKLLVPTAGGWRPIAGFPFTKAQWEDGYKAQRLGRLCKDLARALTSPI